MAYDKSGGSADSFAVEISVDDIDKLESLAPQDLAALGISAERVDQLKSMVADAAAERTQRLASFGGLVAGWVKEAIDARDSSAIETRWREDMRQYYGSEINPSTISMTERVGEGVTEERAEGERQTRSRITVNITRPKANAVIARLGDMLLPTDDKNWGIKNTPNPTLASDMKDEGTQLTQNGQPMANGDGTPMTVADAAHAAITKASEIAKAMEREIDDQLTECNYNAEFRKGLWDLGVFGTMILRGPYAQRSVKRAWKTDANTGKWTQVSEEKYAPATVRVNPWNFFPDPSCGGDIQRSRYTVERDEYNSKTLRALRGQDGFLDDQIEECLREGPRSAQRKGRSNRLSYIEGEYQYNENTTFEVFIVHGEFTKGQLDDAGVTFSKDESGRRQMVQDEERETAVSGCVFLCNGRVIKAYLNPLDGGDLPYSVAQYERVDGQLFGLGVPFILRNPQRVVTAGWRMVMDNAALSSGGQIVINQGDIEPADGSWEIRGTKIWYAKDGTEDVTKAFATFQFDTRQQEIMAIIDRAMQFAEDESNLPAILEGSTEAAPEKVGVANMLSNNANTVLRRLVKTIDDDITDTQITRYYDWNMQHNEKEDIKGDFSVDARGSSVLLVRDLERQSLAQAGQWVTHPTLGAFHKNQGYDWLKTMYERSYISSDILVPEEEVAGVIKKMQEAAQQQPQDPRIAAAQIKANVDQQKLQAQQSESQQEGQLRVAEMQQQERLATLKYANDHSLTIEQVRATLTGDLLKQRHEERMQDREIAVKQTLGSGL